jgi:peptidoglycan/LPS O-acetylase OafA/YrhL
LTWLEEEPIPEDAAEVATEPVRADSPEFSLRYMPGLDVVRGVAITMVLFDHGLGSERLAFDQSPHMFVREIPRILQYGQYGVHLFFILSGFLISGILLDTRHDPDYYRNFYLRRILRIVPAYFLVIGLLKLTGTIDWRFVLVAMLYFCNMSAVFGSSPEYGPFWSLSVEEQFYLVWPLVVRNVTRRTLARLAVAMIVLTPLLRFVLQFGPNALRDMYYKTWVVSDFFAAGALLAIALRVPRLRPHLRTVSLVLMTAGALTLALFQAVPALWLPRADIARHALQPEPYLLLFSGIVLFAVLTPSIARAGLASRALIFLAYISYGLYLVHVLVLDAVTRHWPLERFFPRHPIAEDVLRFLAGALISILLAWISRSTWEKFFLSLKPKHHHSKSTPQTA